MENKYYTPSIEEFHVGFEYEMKQGFMDGTVKSQEDFDLAIWEKRKTTIGELVYIERALTGKNAQNGLCGIRVKHLDREDLLSENWMPERIIHEDDDGNDLFSDGFVFRKTPDIWFELVFISKTDIFIQKKWYKTSLSQMCRTVFFGTILNKSELNKIMKMINILEK